ncbi:MAG: ATP synthase F1 subunit gamma [Bacteroidota bacterium]
MATLREIRQRISAVKNTQKITRAMKMVATAKLRRAQDGIVAARPYARKIKEILQQLSTQEKDNVNALFQAREKIEHVAIVTIASDRGLCGAFNSNIFRATAQLVEQKYVEQFKAGKVELFCVGKKSFDFFSKRNYEIAGKNVGIFNHLEFVHAQTIASELVEGFLKGEYDVVEIVYNEFKSVISQKVSVEQFLPIVPATIAGEKQEAAIPAEMYIYEPDRKKILDALIPRHLNFQIWRALLESNASEQAARMTAMENATTNAQDLISLLQLNYNKARQASITKELLEIVGGAEALAQAS